jgi:hypothetical protein
MNHQAMKKILFLLFLQLFFGGCHKKEEIQIVPSSSIHDYVVYLNAQNRISKIIDTNFYKVQINYYYDSVITVKSNYPTSHNQESEIIRYKVGSKGYAQSSVDTFLVQLYNDTTITKVNYFYNSNGYLTSWERSSNNYYPEYFSYQNND